jgi:hypothetical protein
MSNELVATSSIRDPGVGKPVPNSTAPSQIVDADLHDCISNSWLVVFTMPTNCNLQPGAFAVRSWLISRLQIAADYRPHS